MWLVTTDPTMRYLLLLSLLLGLAACKEAPLPEDLPTRVVVSTAVPTVTEQPLPLTASSTPMPVVDYQGITMTYSDQLWGAALEASSKIAEVDSEGNVLPEHITLPFAGSELFTVPKVHVYPTAHYEASSAEASMHMDLLAAILRDRPVPPTAPLPLFPLPDTISTFDHLPDYVDFQNGSGISFLAQVDRGSEQEVFYIFQGLTNDGSFYVTALLPLKTVGMASGDDADEDETLAQIANRQDLLKLELGDTQELLYDSLRSLRVEPQNEFPSPAPVAYISLPGVLLAYDPELCGEAVAKKTAPTFVSADGSTVFLPGVPDAIQVAFDMSEEGGSPRLTIQPVRDAARQFFPSIPAEQQQLIQMLEAHPVLDGATEAVEDGSGFDRWLAFKSGFGFRQVTEEAASKGEDQPLPVYQFQGVTEDGRYFIQFDHPLHQSGPVEVAQLNTGANSSADFAHLIAQLDQMIQSLVVAPDASTNSSIPANSFDCELDAQFVADVTIPDNTVVERGQTFTKTWRVRNTGTCSWTPAFQIEVAGGNPLSWSSPDLLDVVYPGEETDISVDILSPEVPGSYQAWWQLADETGNQFGTYYYVLFEAPKPATDIPGYGVIQGAIGYPAGDIPAMTIYFLRTDGSQRFALETEDGWDHYDNKLPVGDYYVFARVTGDESDSGGGYTAGVLCGLTCDDHTMVEVSIEEGKATRDVNLIDWYAPAGTFPLPIEE